MAVKFAEIEAVLNAEPTAGASVGLQWGWSREWNTEYMRMLAASVVAFVNLLIVAQARALSLLVLILGLPAAPVSGAAPAAPAPAAAPAAAAAAATPAPCSWPWLAPGLHQLVDWARETETRG